MNSEYYAHSGVAADHSDWQILSDHLRNVARLARQFAEAARPRDAEFAAAAQAAGWLHDLGKYRAEFQQYIEHKRGKGESTRHKHVGAICASRGHRLDLAWAILGHHGGIPDAKDGANQLRREPGLLDKVWPVACVDCPEFKDALDLQPFGATEWELDLRIRLLFSCLVDADWLDTSDHYARCRGLPIYRAPPKLNAKELLTQLERYINGRASACRDPEMGAIRKEVLDASLAAASQSPGLFAMTVPTGGGKTLSSLAFALAHARKFNLQRVIYVAPYLSIIEQNAGVVREAIGDKSCKLVLEHHSLAEPQGRGGADAAESDAAQRLAENWDSPIVVTTSVQFYESLFSNKPGQCRKLHNIAQSVVILDECQTLPKGLTLPTCQMLQQITRYLGCTIVLCTATQPAWERNARLPEGLENVRPIVPAVLNLFSRLKRVRVAWPESDAPPMDWAQVAARMMQRPQALCVVNTKNAARELFGECRRNGMEDVFHLSTAMCPEHRLRVLNEVRDLLEKKKPCYLVSTQLIEAGVDVDFPLVMREIGPLEGIVQAAGRCNREGLLNINGNPGGEVIVFKSIDEALPRDNWYSNGKKVVEGRLKMRETWDIHSPDDLARYYQRLYPTGDLDKHEILKLRDAYQFETVAGVYRIINEATNSVVVMGWEEGRGKIEQILSDIRETSARSAYRRIQRYSVNLYNYDFQKLIASVSLNYLPGVNLCSLPYDKCLGLMPGNTGVLVF